MSEMGRAGKKREKKRVQELLLGKGENPNQSERIIGIIEGQGEGVKLAKKW